MERLSSRSNLPDIPGKLSRYEGPILIGRKNPDRFTRLAVLGMMKITRSLLPSSPKLHIQPTRAIFRIRLLTVTDPWRGVKLDFGREVIASCWADQPVCSFCTHRHGDVRISAITVRWPRAHFQTAVDSGRHLLWLVSPFYAAASLFPPTMTLTILPRLKSIALLTSQTQN